MRNFAGFGLQDNDRRIDVVGRADRLVDKRCAESADHHRLFAEIKEDNSALISVNLCWLLTIVILPFSYSTAPANSITVGARRPSMRLTSSRSSVSRWYSACL